VGTLYDSRNIYDWAGTYDGGPEVPIGPPSRTQDLRVRYQKGEQREGSLTAVTHQAQPEQSDMRLRGDAGVPFNRPVDAPWSAIAPLQADERIAWRPPLEHERSTSARWSATDARDRAVRIGVDRTAERHASDVRARWSGVGAAQRETVLPWRRGLPRGRAVRLRSLEAQPHNLFLRLPWRPGAPFRSGYGIPYGGEPDPPPGSAIIVPPLEVYFMTPVLSILRVSDAVDVLAIDCSVSLSSDAWAWSFQASIPWKCLPLVNPNTHSSPVEVQVTINGYVWKFVVEAFADERKFGGTNCRISGRSLSAYLSADYAPLVSDSNAIAADASQLADDLMPTGWTVTWTSPDWLVAANLFTYADLAPISALAQLAASIGSIVVPDPVDQALTIQPTYPLSPWNWGAPAPANAVAHTWLASHTYAEGDIVTPPTPNGRSYIALEGGNSGAIEPATWPTDSGESFTDGGVTWQLVAAPYAKIPKAFWTSISGQWEGNFVAGYNGVYVSGQNSGVSGRVKRAGTDGAALLPSVSDALICHVDAARERGRHELAKADRRKTETLRLPLLPAPAGIGNPGVLQRGQLLQLEEIDGTLWLGQVLSVQIDATRSSTALSVRQTASVERHA